MVGWKQHLEKDKENEAMKRYLQYIGSKNYYEIMASPLLKGDILNTKQNDNKDLNKIVKLDTNINKNDLLHISPNKTKKEKNNVMEHEEDTKKNFYVESQ